jgi:CheY-like chemotaxis protein
VTLPLEGKRVLVASEDAELAGLVAAAAARLGAESVLASTGRAAADALAREPHVAVLDLPFPDLGAAELLAACGRAAAPALVVSGVHRGPGASEELRRLGARGLFEKPFAIDALLEAATAAVGAASAAALDREALDEVTGARPLPADADAISAAPVFALDAPPPATRSAPRDGFATPLPDTAAPVRMAEPDAPPPATGDLARSSVPRLLVALHIGQATGALTITRGPVKKILVVERGVPVYAASNVPAERLAAIAVRRGIVAAERLDALRRERPTARTAELLADAGLLVAEKHAEIVGAQIRAIAWSTYEWRDGSYAFQLGRPPAGRVPVKLAVADLVLEGILRTATLPRLGAELPADAHLAPSQDPAFELYALKLSGAQAHLLSLADGTKSTADLVRLSELPEREALAFLWACRVMRVLDEVSRVLASTRRIGFM